MNQSGAEARRERGVLAQREYRKRHASKVQKLQDENKKLKDVIGNICLTLRAGGPLPDNVRAALSNVRDVAGIVSRDSNAKAAESGQEEAEEKETSQPLSEDAPAPPARSSNPKTSRATPLLQQQLVPSGRLSPRLDYGLWLETDRLIRVMEPPVDIVPYLGAGADTLAGCIFWSTMNHAIDLWNSRSAQPSARRLDRMFGHSRHLDDREFLLSLAQARVDFRRQGFMFRKLSEQFERNATTKLHELIRADYEGQQQQQQLQQQQQQQQVGRLSRLRWWKRPEEVAEYVLGLMTPAQIARTRTVVEGKGAADGAEAAMLRALVAWFAQNFVCFGDGPRWNSVFLSVTVGSWIRKFRALDSSVE